MKLLNIEMYINAKKISYEKDEEYENDFVSHDQLRDAFDEPT